MLVLLVAERMPDPAHDRRYSPAQTSGALLRIVFASRLRHDDSSEPRDMTKENRVLRAGNTKHPIGERIDRLAIERVEYSAQSKRRLSRRRTGQYHAVIITNLRR